jgi:hypothetical protein
VWDILIFFRIITIMWSGFNYCSSRCSHLHDSYPAKQTSLELVHVLKASWERQLRDWTRPRQLNQEDQEPKKLRLATGRVMVVVSSLCISLAWWRSCNYLFILLLMIPSNYIINGHRTLNASFMWRLIGYSAMSVTKVHFNSFALDID